MLMKDFRNTIAPSAILKIQSYYNDETIKECTAIDLSEDDMNLVIQSIHASVYFNIEKKAYLGMFVLCVTEEVIIDMETKQYLNRIYGMKISSDDKEKLKEYYQKEFYHSGKTHADMSKVNPVNMIKTKDKALCMYDYAKEILDLTEGYADTDSVDN